MESWGYDYCMIIFHIKFKKMGRSRHIWHETAFFRSKFAFFLELCIVLIVVFNYLTTFASYFMRFKGKIGGCFELYKRRKFRE